MTAVAKPAFYDRSADYTDLTVDRQQRAAASVEGRQAAGKVIRLARHLLREVMDDVGPGAQDFLAYSAAASIVPMRSETVIAAYDVLATTVDARGQQDEEVEPEIMDLLLALGDLLRLLRIDPRLHFYPHNEGRRR